MSRMLRLATVLLACGTVVSACTLDSGPYSDQGAGATGTGPGGSSGSAGAGGTSSGGATTGGTGTGGISPLCGNSKVDPGEECDDGNQVNDDICTNGCKTAKCGDGITQAVHGDECDDGNNVDNDKCTNQCKLPKCGDKIVQASNNEECDLGSDMNADTGACTSGCKNAKCGDGFIEAGAEMCDDHNAADGDGCSKDCAPEPGWMCSGMPSKCTSTCGDGIAVGSEACDDGNTSNEDGCSATCKLEGTCGDGYVGPGEICDGGAGCMNCTQIDPNKTCGKAVPISPMPPDAKGVIVTEITGDTLDSPPTQGDLLLPPSYDAGAKQAKLFTYTTGKRGSIVTVATKKGNMTFDDTVVWVYRDCLGKGDEEACNDDIDKAGGNLYSSATTGYLPARSTIYIGLAGGKDMQKGKFVLDITEQPVTLFLGVTFNYGDLGGLTSDAQGSTGKWVHCDGGACGMNSTGSWSGKGYALADDNPDVSWNTATLRSDALSLKGLPNMFFQCDIDFTEMGPMSATFTMQQRIDAGLWADILTASTNYSRARQTKDVSAAVNGAAKLSVGFTFHDGAGTKAGNAKVDDLWVYGY